MGNTALSIALDAEILSRTPPEVIELLLRLLHESDSPFDKRPEATKKAKKPRKRKGVRQQCLRPTELLELYPEKCACGCRTFEEQEAYYVHQVIELPEIQMDIRHIILYRGNCAHCGKTGKAIIPSHMRTGFGPRLENLNF